MPKDKLYDRLNTIEKSPLTPNQRLADELAKLGLQPQYLVAKGSFYYRPPANGYTSQISEAARYTKEEAESHVRHSGVLHMEQHHPNFETDLNEMLRVEELFARHEVDLYENYEKTLKAICMNDWMNKKRDIQSATSATADQRFRAACKTLGL